MLLANRNAARERITGLLLALGVNAAFFAVFYWQTLPRRTDVPEPSRMTLVWARVLAAPAPPTPESVRRPAVRSKPAPTAAIVVRERPAAAPAAELVIESDSADPFEQSRSATAASFDKAVMGKAINAALAERRALEDTQKFVKSARAPTRFEQFAVNVEDATMPYCLGRDSMKHSPPVIDVAGVKVGLAGVLALPFLVKAVAQGKCRIK